MSLVSAEFEIDVLGGLMLTSLHGEPMAGELAGVLGNDAFTRPDHRAIYATICSLAKGDKPHDGIAVAEAMKGNPDGIEFADIVGMMHNTPGTVNLETRARHLRDLASRRALIGACHEAMKAVEHESASEAIAGLSAKLDSILGSGGADALSFDEVLYRAEKQVDELFQQRSKGGPLGVPFGIPAMDSATGGMRPGELIGVAARTSIGKCLALGTRVIQANGSDIAVERLKVGDSLLGPDGKPRRVVAVHEGNDDLYRVDQVCGDSYVVNSQHIMSLQVAPGSCRFTVGDILSISLPEYSLLPAREKRALRGWVPGPVEFDCAPKCGATDPYLLGLWIAEGKCGHGFRLYLNRADYEHIKSRLPHHRVKLDSDNCLEITVFGRVNPLRIDGVVAHKHVPDWIRFGSLETRRQFLSGYLDGDGGKMIGGIEAVTISDEVADGIVWVARSLGFRVSVTRSFKKCQNFSGAWYARIGIKGDFHDLPMMVRRKIGPVRSRNSRTTGIKISPNGRGRYVGIQVDGDSLFLLRDWTVVHNTALANQFAVHAASKGHRGLIISLEESPEGIGLRAIANRGGVNLMMMRGGSVRLDDVSDVVNRNAMRDYKLWVDTQTFDLTTIASRITQYVRKHKIAFAVVDHVGLVRVPAAGGKKRYETLGEVTRTLKLLAGQLGIAIVCLIQVGRDSEKESRRPMLSDLRESGNIEQDLNVCIAMHPKAPPDERGKVDLEIGLLKNRYGIRGWLSHSFEFHGSVQQLRQMFHTEHEDHHAA